MDNASAPGYPRERRYRSDFWLEDGNLVIDAGSVLFKVHKGQLMRHSKIFFNLFTLPQEAGTLHDFTDGSGCQGLELLDCPTDVFYFLTALYDGLYFKKPRAGDFPILAGVLRLSTKYRVEYLRQVCLERLQADWPATLTDWDLRERRCTEDAATKRYLPRDHCAHPILVIELALELNLLSMLPSAFYDLSRYGPSKIMTGTTGQITTFDRRRAAAYGAPAPVGRPVQLSRDLLRRTLHGRECSQRFIADFIAKELNSRKPATDCANIMDASGPSRPCFESFYFIMLNILRSVGGIACGRDADPLFTLVQATEMLSRTDFSDGQRQCGLRLCEPCKTEFAVSTAKAREDIWSSIPTWFALDNIVKPQKFPTPAIQDGTE